MAIKKLGMAMPTIVNVRAPKSSQLSGFTVEITPNGTEKITERTIANTASSKVLGIRSPNSLMTTNTKMVIRNNVGMKRPILLSVYCCI